MKPLFAPRSPSPITAPLRVLRTAFWTAPVRWRFGNAARDQTVRNEKPKRPPLPNRADDQPPDSRSVLECGSPSDYAARQSAASARRRLPLSTRVPKAPEDWRTPRPGGPTSSLLAHKSSWCAAALAVLTLITAGCHRPGSHTAPPPPQVTVSIVEQRELVEW